MEKLCCDRNLQFIYKPQSCYWQSIFFRADGKPVTISSTRTESCPPTQRTSFSRSFGRFGSVSLLSLRPRHPAAASLMIGDDVMLTRFRLGKLKTDLLTFNFIKLYNPGGECPLLPSTQTVIVSKIKQLGAAGAGHSCVAQQCIVTRGPGSRSTLVLDLTPSRPARRHHRYLHNLFSRH